MPAPVISLLAFAVALGVLVFVPELGHFMVAKRVGVKVLRFSIGFGRVMFSRWRGETEYAGSAVPLGGYGGMLGEGGLDDPGARAEPERTFEAQPVHRRVAIVLAGPVMNLLLAFVMYVGLYSVYGVPTSASEPRVGGVLPGSAAEHAGLKTGDLVLQIDEQSIPSWEALAKTVESSGGRRLQLRVQREGNVTTLEVTPELKENPPGMGEPGMPKYRIGIEVSWKWEGRSLPESIGLAAQNTFYASVQVARGLGLVVMGRVPASELGGPIAIARTAGEKAKSGLRDFLAMLAFLSVNLGVLNLFPVPGLDGGQLAFLTIEGVLRRPLRARYREILQQVGVLLLITLMVFVFFNDIHRLVQG